MRIKSLSAGYNLSIAYLPPNKRERDRERTGKWKKRRGKGKRVMGKGEGKENLCLSIHRVWNING